eukprot:Colp12_sorted_trinity150504_noHs@3109
MGLGKPTLALVACAFLLLATPSCCASQGILKIGAFGPLQNGVAREIIGQMLFMASLVNNHTDGFLDQEFRFLNYDLAILPKDSEAQSKIAAELCWEFVHIEKVVGILGGLYSSESQGAQYILQLFNIPQISPSATSPELSDKSRYPTFLRTSFDDSVSVAATLGLIKAFGWRQTAILAATEPYALANIQSFAELGPNLGVTVDPIKVHKGFFSPPTKCLNSFVAPLRSNLPMPETGSCFIKLPTFKLQFKYWPAFLFLRGSLSLHPFLSVLVFRQFSSRPLYP